MLTMLVGLSGCAGPAQEYCQRLGEILEDPSLTCEDDPYLIDMAECVFTVSDHCTTADAEELNANLDCSALKDCELQATYDECRESVAAADCDQLDAFSDCVKQHQVSELCEEGLVAAEF